MDYKIMGNNKIEIMPEGTPIRRVLEEIARQSYATSVIRTSLQQKGGEFPTDAQVKSFDAGLYLEYEPTWVEQPRGWLGNRLLGPKTVRGEDRVIRLNLDYSVDCRQCKTDVNLEKGRWLFDIGSYHSSENPNKSPRDPIKLLEAVKAALGGHS